MALKPITVTQLNEYIHRVIATDPLLGAVVVRGEITNLRYHSSGHVYFSIMDAASKINCFLAREYAAQLPWMLTDGMEVILTGGVSVYKKQGTYSLYVRAVERAGAGDLALAFEEMKAKLAAEGLFDPAHKKPIPAYPQKIGVITSRTGAALQDILKIIQMRNRIVDVMVFPVLVQGDQAPADIAARIDFVNARFPEIDTLIVGRGGGSAEDLSVFNAEEVARSIYASRIPVISAVGHEIDITIADLVADVRAETPTAAASLAVPDTAQLAGTVRELGRTLQTHLANKLMYQQLHLQSEAKRMADSLQRRLGEAERLAEQYRLLLEENDPNRVLENGYAVLQTGSGQVVRSVEELHLQDRCRLTLRDGTAACVITEIGGGNDAREDI